MRHAAGVRHRLAALLLFGTFGCEREAEPRPAPDPVSVERPPSPSSSFDPFEGIEGLRPERWTGWPLENVHLATEGGWRLDPVSGQYVLERGLSLSTDPGEFVLAIAAGKVTEVTADGNVIELVIDHGDGIESRYAPLGDALVHVGLPVTRGAAIGLTRGKILRLVVTVDGVAIDPLLVLRQPLHRWPALLRELPRPIEPPPSG